jgi:probable F420-dependent oxidoreductase
VLPGDHADAEAHLDEHAQLGGDREPPQRAGAQRRLPVGAERPEPGEAVSDDDDPRPRFVDAEKRGGDQDPARLATEVECSRLVRFSYAESMTDPSFYAPLAQAAEAAGFDTMVVPDSICYPRESDSTYPYNPDGSREFLEDKPFLDPFALSAALGMVTSTLRFVTFVLKLPVRHPLLVAKQATSVSVLTGGRFALGVGTSPWEEDYLVTGTPSARKGKRMDECMQIIRGESSGDWFSFAGEMYDVPELKICPGAPVPLLVGGHADVALRRAVTLGDGWMHGGGDPADLPRLLDRLSELRRVAGRADDGFEIHVISMDAYTVDGVRRLEDLGVTDVIVGFRWPYDVGPDTEPLSAKTVALARSAYDVIANVNP